MVGVLAGTIGEDHSYPGVSPLGDSQYHHHKFYQWVIFFLTLQVGESEGIEPWLQEVGPHLLSYSTDGSASPALLQMALFHLLSYRWRCLTCSLKDGTASPAL